MRGLFLGGHEGDLEGSGVPRDGLCGHLEGSRWDACQVSFWVGSAWVGLGVGLTRRVCRHFSSFAANLVLSWFFPWLEVTGSF